MAKKKPIATKADTARAFLREHPRATRKDMQDQIGLDMRSSQFTDVRRGVWEELKLKKAQPKPTTKRPRGQGEIATLKRRIAQLEADIAYQQWRTFGERHGFVLRLLEEEAHA